MIAQIVRMKLNEEKVSVLNDGNRKMASLLLGLYQYVEHIQHA